MFLRQSSRTCPNYHKRVGLQENSGSFSGFLYAGTPAIVTTLWKVDDRASYELVRAFYERLADAGPVQALRDACTTATATVTSSPTAIAPSSVPRPT